MIYIAATPIGNLGDITLRAIESLKNADYIVAEDTRTAGRLLKHLEIEKKPFISYNDFNSKKKVPEIIELAKQGNKIVLISENGTPAISDPGYRLISEAIKESIDVIPVPGATAFVTALIASGLPTDSFTFHGFLPKSKKKKSDLFLAEDSKIRTTIYYESPHRIIKTLDLLNDILPQRQICVARELTKKFEEFVRGTSLEVYEIFKDKKPKGEFVLIVGKE